MKDINELIKASRAPFNRNERYFTGTVLSVLFSGNHFKDLEPITKIMAPTLALAPMYSSETKNLLFYTEYDLRRSSYANGTAPAHDEEIAGDTPDVVFYIFVNGTVYLFAIEAKMFDRPNYKRLKEQMEGQMVNLKKLARLAKIPDRHIFHFALVPAKYGVQFTDDKNIITWEDILKIYKGKTANQHCIDSLEHALAQFDSLISRVGTRGENSTGKYSGSTIASDHQELGIRYVGCNGGLREFKELVAAGTWKDRPFEVTIDSSCPNWKWFSIRDFLDTTGDN